MLPPNGSTESQRLRWFRNLAPGTAFDQNSVSLDFSLQLGVGIQNLKSFQDQRANLAGFRAADVDGLSRFLKAGELPSEKWNREVPQEFRFSRDPSAD